MYPFLRQLARSRKGATVIEYAMLVGILAIGIMVAVFEAPQDVWGRLLGLNALAG